MGDYQEESTWWERLYFKIRDFLSGIDKDKYMHFVLGTAVHWGCIVLINTFGRATLGNAAFLAFVVLLLFEVAQKKFNIGKFDFKDVIAGMVAVAVNSAGLLLSGLIKEVF